MIPELGQFALLLALGVALVQGTLPLVGAARGRADWMALARPGRAGAVRAGRARLRLPARAPSSATTSRCSTSPATPTRALPLPYRFAAVWGGARRLAAAVDADARRAGRVAVARFSRHLPDDGGGAHPRRDGLVSVGFLLFMLLTSNPFERLLPAAADGRDLNPLLQDPGMVIHPPMLYMGYVGFSVAFAFAIAALLGGKLDAAWARWSRPWTTAAWIFLTLGIALGSWWAYYELGWGGWWFWDPVENASFMPWLVGTALIHSLAVTEKRGALQGVDGAARDRRVLAVAARHLPRALGRADVGARLRHRPAARPVHPRLPGRRDRRLAGAVRLARADGRAGRALRRWSRARRCCSPTTCCWSSRCGAVLLGTLYPLVLDALGLGKISVGPPYFDAVFVPLMAPLRLPDGRRAAGALEAGRAARPGARACAGRAVRRGRRARSPPAGCAGSIGVVGDARPADGVLDRRRGRDRPGRAPAARRRRCARPAAAARASCRARWSACMLAHLGVAVFIFGVTLVQDLRGRARRADERRRHAPSSAATSSPSAACARCTGPNYGAAQGADRGHARRPAGGARCIRRSASTACSRTPMTEAAIDAGFTRDLYVSLGEPVGGGAWIVRVYVKPFVDWIWGGCLLMALGGVLAASDRRYRAKRARDAPAATAPRGERRHEALCASSSRWRSSSLLAVFLARRPEARPARGAVAADRQAGAGVRAAAAGRRRRRRSAATTCCGKVWVLNVWASWCVACREEHPLLVEFAKQQVGADRRPQLQGQARRRPRPGCARFGNPYDASLFDADGRVGIDFGVYGVPETFVIDKHGVDPLQAHRPADARGARRQASSRC